MREICATSDAPPGIGVPGWHSRGYLPHFDGGDAIQHVTFHLADSMPREVVERLEADISREPVEKREVARRKRLEDWIDAGHGCCILREPAIAEMVQNTLLFFDGQRYRSFAWVVMPNHVHVLFQPLSGCTLAQIVESWKKFTATRIQCRFENDTIWLTQALLAELFQKAVRTINEHLVNIFDDGKLSREATIRKFRIVANGPPFASHGKPSDA